MSEDPKIVSFAEKTGKQPFAEVAADMAKHYRTIFDAFRGEGFSEEQGMQLVLGLYMGAHTELIDE